MGATKALQLAHVISRMYQSETHSWYFLLGPLRIFEWKILNNDLEQFRCKHSPAESKTWNLAFKHHIFFKISLCCDSQNFIFLLCLSQTLNSTSPQKYVCTITPLSTQIIHSKSVVLAKFQDAASLHWNLRCLDKSVVFGEKNCDVWKNSEKLGAIIWVERDVRKIIFFFGTL